MEQDHQTETTANLMDAKQRLVTFTRELVALEDDNLARLVYLLEQWEFKPRVPVALTDLAREPLRSHWIESKGMKAFCVVNC